MRQPKPAAKPHSFERPALRGLKLTAPAPETPAMAKTVLIVDDSSSLRTVVKMALVRAGYEVLEGVDGRDGLAQLDKAAKVHLIVSDVNMPNMDGIAFVTQVKQHPRHKFTPVIMLTTEGQDEKKAIQSGLQSERYNCAKKNSRLNLKFQAETTKTRIQNSN